MSKSLPEFVATAHHQQTLLQSLTMRLEELVARTIGPVSQPVADPFKPFFPEDTTLGRMEMQEQDRDWQIKRITALLDHFEEVMGPAPVSRKGSTKVVDITSAGTA